MFQSTIIKTRVIIRGLVAIVRVEIQISTIIVIQINILIITTAIIAITLNSLSLINQLRFCLLNNNSHSNNNNQIKYQKRH